MVQGVTFLNSKSQHEFGAHLGGENFHGTVWMLLAPPVSARAHAASEIWVQQVCFHDP